MERRVTDYDLTMNVEQDSQGSTEYIAALYTPAIGHHQGRGKEPHLAVIALAYKIMEWDQINARTTKPLTAGADELKKISEAMIKAWEQPTQKTAWPFYEPAHPADIEAFRNAYTRAGNTPILPADAPVEYHPQAPSVGRIVWYWPEPGEIEDHRGGPLPAFITRVVHGFNINVQVTLDKDGSRFVPGIDYGGGKIVTCGTWTWPTKK
jgi:hypothetical protein